MNHHGDRLPVIGNGRNCTLGPARLAPTGSPLVGVLLLSVACARAPSVIEAPVAVVVDSVVAETLFVAPDTMGPYRTPEFRPLPLVSWGAPPPGTRHRARARTFDLQHQTVRVRFDPSRRAVSGSTTLRVAPLSDSAPVTSIVLDAVGMTIRSVTGAGGAPLRHDHDGRTLAVHLANPLTGRASTSITIEYEAVRPAKGVYFVPRRGIAWTQGEPEDTRFWVPTFDHPGDKTTWEIIVRTRPDEMALSNGRLVSRRRVGDSLEWHWSLASPASTYLMSVVTGDFTVLEDRWREVPVGYWTYADSIAATWRGLGKTPRMIDFLSVRTGVSYPWPKYDQIVVPDFIHGGMENVTATTMSDDAILHPRWAAPHAAAATESLVVHELAHHWFGNLVTARDWAHVWLHEGFARMLEAQWREAEHGADEAEYARLVVREAALAADQRARRPLVHGEWATDPLELFLSGHVYARGAAVLEMLRAELGDSVFRAGVARYLGDHRFASVETSDLRLAMEAAAGRDLAGFFGQWVEGAGYPAFRVSFAFDRATRTLALDAAQVHARDALTGIFRTTVGVTVLTDSGAVSTTIAVRDSATRATMALQAPPRAILWGSDDRTLQVADFPRPVVMLAWQLAHAGGVPARVEALRSLGERLEEPSAVAAIARASRDDAFWAVRARAAALLGGAASAVDSALSALLEVTRDDDPRVREQAALALGALGADTAERRALADALVLPPFRDSLELPLSSAGLVDPRWVERIERLVELSGGDESRFVRAAAVKALAKLDGERGLSVARVMLARDGWRHVERRAAIEALATIGGPKAVAALEARLAAEGDASVRAALEAALVQARSP